VVVGVSIAGLGSSDLNARASSTVTDTTCTATSYAADLSHVSNPGTITFDCVRPADIILTTTTSVASGHTLTVDRAGAAVSLNGGGAVQVFDVASGGTLTLDDLTVTHGDTSGFGGGVQNDGNVTITSSVFSDDSSGDGSGGLFNDGTATISGSTFSENSGGFGGGIYNAGTITITLSTFSGNSSIEGGGGVANDAGGTATITDSTFSGGSSTTNGGGLYNDGTATITSSTFSSAFAHSGGGLMNDVSGITTVTDSTFSTNTANQNGGGLDNDGGIVSLTNSTVYGNGSGYGGGFYNSGIAGLTNSTFSDNSSSFGGGGVQTAGGSATITNSIVAENPGSDCDFGSALTDGGYNLESGTDCGFTGTGDQQNANPLLGPLASNGGPTQTMALYPTSPAIDVIPQARCPATDQRGDPRPDAGESFCDVGAYESAYAPLSNYTPITPFRILDTRTTSPLGPGGVHTLQVTGAGTPPIPANTTAVVMNVTEVSGSASSLLTVYPAGTPRPNASNLNFAAHTVIPNLVTVAVGSTGGVDIYNALGTVNVLADVEGYFTPQAATHYQGLFHPLSPYRVCDTRSSCEGHAALGAGQAIVVNVTGASQIPIDGTAGAAVLNLTGVAGTAATYLSVFATDSSGGCAYSGSHAPPFSTLNLSAHGVEANRVMVGLGPVSTGGPDTSVCVYNAAGTINVILDANGWFGSATATASPGGYQYQAIAPTRICDTRVGSGSCVEGGIGPAHSRLIDVAGFDGIPGAASGVSVVAIIANLTAIAPTTATYLTLYPANLAHVPVVSDLNLDAGVVLPNLALVALAPSGDANAGDAYLYNSAGTVNAVIDVEGWFQ